MDYRCRCRGEIALSNEMVVKNHRSAAKVAVALAADVHNYFVLEQQRMLRAGIAYARRSLKIRPKGYRAITKLKITHMKSVYCFFEYERARSSQRQRKNGFDEIARIEKTPNRVLANGET